MSKNTLKGLSALAATTSMLALSTPAYAQLEDIVVTATKVEKSLQEVSATISAFDVEALEAYRIEGVEDIAQYTPGMYTQATSANSNGVRVALRGVGTYDPQLGVDSKVAIYTDGVYMGKVVGLGFDSPDLERVEVLKGPQGTLYGRNAVAGAINLISAAPDPTETFGKVKAELGNYNALGISGSANFAINESAALRVSGKYSHRDGWVENQGQGADFGGYDRYGVRAAFGVDVSDDLSFVLSAETNKSTNEPHFYQSFDIGCGRAQEPALPCSADALFGAAVVGATSDRIESWNPSGIVGDGFAKNDGASLVADWDFLPNHSLKSSLSWRTLDSERYVILNPQVNPAIAQGILSADVSPAPGVQSINNFFASVPSVVALTPGASVRSDYFTQIPRAQIDGFYQSPDGKRQPAVEGHEQYSFETTFTGSFSDGKLEYTAGVFAYDEKTSTGASTRDSGDAQDYLDVIAPVFAFAAPGAGCNQLSGLTLPASVYAGCSAFIPDAVFTGNPGFGFAGVTLDASAPVIAPGVSRYIATSQTSAGALAGFYSGALINSLEQLNFSAGNFLKVDTRAYAIFGQATYHVSDDLRLIGGLRYSEETKDGFHQSSSPFFRDFTNLMGNPITPQSSSLSFDSLDPQAIIEYDINDDMMVYASYSEAFRSGGFNASASVRPVAPATIGSDFEFQPEEITSYEIGFKGDLSDRLRLNASAFYYDIPNEQVTVSIDPLISTKRAIVNSETEIWGIEAETTYAITDEFTLLANAAYIKGETDDIVSPNPAVGVVTRDSIQGSPELSYTISGNYERQLENGMDFFSNLTYSYTDEVEQTPFMYVSDQNLVSGRIGVSNKMANGQVATFTVWGQNLTDDEYTIDSIPFGPLAAEIYAFGPPRTYGVSLGYSF